MADLRDLKRFPVLLIYDVDPTWSELEQEEARRACRRLGYAMRRWGHSVRFLPVTAPDLPSILAAYDPRDVIVFNWCEGLPGLERSEAWVAETLERLRFTYTGASSDVLKRCYDKPQVKRTLQSQGVPTPKWKLFQSPTEGGWNCFPAIVKPACEHCSFGIDSGAVVVDPTQLSQRVSYVLDTFQQPAIVEDFVDGREFHVPIWGNDQLEMLPPVEIDFSALDNLCDRLCSYDSKFIPESTAYRKIKSWAPARLSAEEMSQLEAASKAAYKSLDCRDYGRIDVRLRDGVFYVLDVNPNADIGFDASLAMSAGKAGYCYGAMGSRMLEFALERHPHRQMAENASPKVDAPLYDAKVSCTD
jgi:D-alanine-D-alanine ligase